MSPRSFALVRGGVGRERSAGLARVEASNNLFLSRNWEKGEKFTIILILPGWWWIYGGDFRRIQKILCPDLYSFSWSPVAGRILTKSDNRTSRRHMWYTILYLLFLQLILFRFPSLHLPLLAARDDLWSRPLSTCPGALSMFYLQIHSNIHHVYIRTYISFCCQGLCPACGYHRGYHHRFSRFSYITPYVLLCKTYT